MPLPISNVFSALRLIQLAAREGGVTFAQLQQELGWNRKQVLDYIDALNNIELIEEPERGYVGPDGYIDFTIDNQSIRVFNPLALNHPINLSERNLAALLMAFAWAADLELLNREEAEALKAKLLRTQETSTQSIKIEGVEVFGADVQPGGNHLQLLSEAADRSQLVRLDYHSKRQGSTSSRLVAPGRLYFREGLWYLRGYQQEVNGQEPGWRSFRLDRIRACELLPESFDRNQLPELDQLEKLFLFEDGEMTRTRTWYSPRLARYLRETVPAEAIKEQADGSIIVDRDVVGFPFYRSYVLQFGPEAKVLEPADFRDAIRTHLENQLQQL